MGKRIKKTEHIGNRTQVLGPEIPCTTTMLYALATKSDSIESISYLQKITSRKMKMKMERNGKYLN